MTRKVDTTPHESREDVGAAADSTEDKQKAARSQARAILEGFTAAATVYGVARRAVGAAAAEDVVDMMHSAYTSGVALQGICSLQKHPIFWIALPAHLEDGLGPVVRMFCRSAGYFLADVCLILVEVGARGQHPALWLGRLAHHALQLVCNLASTFKRGSALESHALRSGLCMAYFAEFSTIFLRLRSLTKRMNLVSVRRVVDWSLLLSFAFSRLVNFGFLIRCWVNCRQVVSPLIFRFFLGIQCSVYLMNVGWFAKIAQGTLKLHTAAS